MKKYKNPLTITSQFSFCGVPFRLDTYAGCEFSCIYCFSNKRGGNSDKKIIKKADPDKIINKIKNAINNPKITTGLTSQLIRRKMPIHFGGMSDPFQPIEKKEKVSLKVLKYLCEIKYPVIISTKSVLIQTEEYLEVIKTNPNLIVQISLSCIDDAKAKVLEPLSPSPSERLKCLNVLKQNNIKTAIRWQPYVIGFSESPIFFVKQIVSSGIKHLIIEFLKLPTDNNGVWKKELKPLVELRSFYANSRSQVIGREMVLNTEYKVELIKELKNALKGLGITLGVGDNDIQHLSQTKCCCGIDSTPGFENWNKYQFTYAIMNHEKGKIYYDSINNQWKPTGSLDKHINSKSRIIKEDGYNQVADYILARWQNLSSIFNPSKYAFVEDSQVVDSDGIRIFVVDENKMN